LRGFALKHENVFTSGGSEVICDAGADDSSADDDDVRSVHDEEL
jgi:hypothetical protein